jgi:hypothetical protein
MQRKSTPHSMRTMSLSTKSDCKLAVQVTGEETAVLESRAEPPGVTPTFCAELWALSSRNAHIWDTKSAQLAAQANVHAAMPVRPFPRPARRARAVSAAIGRFVQL